MAESHGKSASQRRSKFCMHNLGKRVDIFAQACYNINMSCDDKKRRVLSWLLYKLRFQCRVGKMSTFFPTRVRAFRKEEKICQRHF